MSEPNLPFTSPKTRSARRRVARAARADQVEVLDWALCARAFLVKRASWKRHRAFRASVASPDARGGGGALGALRRCEFLLTCTALTFRRRIHRRRPRRLRNVLTESEQRNDCAIAAFGGHLDALGRMHHSGYGVNEWTCTRAAEGGHLEVLEWARENGRPWDCRGMRRRRRAATTASRRGFEQPCPAEELPLRRFGLPRRRRRVLGSRDQREGARLKTPPLSRRDARYARTAASGTSHPSTRRASSIDPQSWYCANS